MTRQIGMARFNLGWPLAGAGAALLSAAMLGALCVAHGLPGWMALNATTHVLHGPAAATVTALDLAHTGLGAAIHLASCCFWAAVAVLLVRKASRGGFRLALGAGLVTALVAGLVDYGLMPTRLRPGWELVLPPIQVAAGLAAMGVGLALGLIAAQAIGRTPKPPAPPPHPEPHPEPPAPQPHPDPRPEPPLSAIERLRQPAPATHRPGDPDARPAR